jgi:TRAP-type C4-dicarboxylate transport system permease large subunit
MFKKTLIDMSLAAVTGSAMADVAVSGRVEQPSGL